MVRMKFEIPKLCFVLLFHQYLCVKIKIEQCQTDGGSYGFCRPVEECVGFEGVTSSTCSGDMVCCPRRRVSQNKCMHYADSVYSANAGMNLKEEEQDFDQLDECGIVGVPLIIGGEKAAEREFPHLAALGFGESLEVARWMCGSALISEHFVLSVAHCIVNQQAGLPKFVKFGALNVKTDRHEFIEIRQVEQYIVHPRYRDDNKANDIALLRLDREVAFSPFIRPACLDYTGTIKQRKALAAGWGKTNEAHKDGSPDLMKVQLDIINKTACVRSFRRRFKRGMEESRLCAGSLLDGKDTCQGDSGSPLQTIKEEPYCMYNLIGLTSFGGASCGLEFSCAIYTRIFSFIPWIETQVWPNEE